MPERVKSLVMYKFCVAYKLGVQEEKILRLLADHRVQAKSRSLSDLRPNMTLEFVSIALIMEGEAQVSSLKWSKIA